MKNIPRSSKGFETDWTKRKEITVLYEIHIWARCPDCRAKTEWWARIGLKELLGSFLLCRCGKVLRISEWNGRVFKDNEMDIEDIRMASADIRLRKLGFDRTLSWGLYRYMKGELAIYVDLRRGYFDAYVYKDRKRIRFDYDPIVDRAKKDVEWLWFDPYAKGKQRSVEERILAQYAKVWRSTTAEEGKKIREEVKRLMRCTKI